MVSFYNLWVILICWVLSHQGAFIESHINYKAVNNGGTGNVGPAPTHRG